MSDEKTICRTCGLELRATGDPENPIVHEDHGDPEKRRGAMLAHFDEQEQLDKARRA